MTYEHSSTAQHGVSTYLRASAYDPHHDPVATPKPRLGFTIAIGREAGIDAASYARTIAEQLDHWSVMDGELLQLIANRLGSRTSMLECVDERHVSWIKESIEAFLAWHTISQATYVRHLVETVHELGALGECLIVGRGAAHILPAETTLRVRLVAPVNLRVAAFAREMGISNLEFAMRELLRIDRERTRFVVEHFHKDPSDPTSYDLVLNIAHLSHDDCAKLVVDGLRALEFQRAPATLNRSVYG